MSKCGNCNIDFQSKAQLVRHNLQVHETVFLEGSEDLQAIQDTMASKDADVKALIDKKRKEVE